MDLETRQFISQSEANRTDKQSITTALTYVALGTALLAAVNAVLLFIVNGFILNYITLAYAILNIILILLSLFTFLWSRKQYQYLEKTDDDWGEETDDFQGRVAFFLTIFLAIVQLVFLILYVLAQDYIFGLYAASSESANLEKFDRFLQVTLPFIVIITMLIIGSLVFQIHSFYQLTISHSTSRFHIFMLSIVVGLNTWALIYILQGLGIYLIAIILNFIVIGIILVAVIANIWRFKQIFIVLASVQVLLIPALLTYQAQFIRDYQQLYRDLNQNCQELMNKIPQAHIEYNNCYSKYVYETKGCPAGQSKCPSTECTKNAMVQMWDQKKEGGDQPLGCLNLQCCSQTSSLYTKDYLQLSGFSLAGSLFLFALILFEFHLSRMARGEKTLGRNLETLFVVLFLGTIIFGILLLAQPYPSVPTKQQPEFNQQKVLKADKFYTADLSHCKTIQQLAGSRVILSGECKEAAECPLNKLEKDKRTDLLFGIWVKNIKRFLRKEQTIYQTAAAAKFIWPTYDGNGQDFFAIVGGLAEVQKYVDDLQLCFDVGQTELDIKLYQNLIDFPTAAPQQAKQRIMHDHFENGRHITGTISSKSPVAPFSAFADAGAAQPKGKCSVPNCSQCAQDSCTDCMEGFKVDAERGCLYTGLLKRNQQVIVPLYKSVKAKVSGYVVGAFRKEDEPQETVVPLQNVVVTWTQEGQQNLEAKTNEKGKFELELTTLEVADYSTQLYQPTGGQISVVPKGFSAYIANQVLDYETEIYLGTIKLRSEVVIPKKAAAPANGSPKSTARHSSAAAGTVVNPPSSGVQGAAGPQSCKQDEYLDGDKKCQKSLCNKVLNCLFCDSDNNCLSCATDYQLVKDKDNKFTVCEPRNRCDKPPSQNNCFKCKTENNKSVCTECDAFSSLEPNGECKKLYKLCQPVVENCSICSIDNKCAFCVEGYKLENGLCKNIDVVGTFSTDYFSVRVAVYDVDTQEEVEGAHVEIYHGVCGSAEKYGYEKTDSHGGATFKNLIKRDVYSVKVKHPEYSSNCIQFKESAEVVVPISANLKPGQSRIVLEWDTDADLDLLVSFNPLPKTNCLVAYLNKECTGVRYGRANSLRLKFESVMIEQLSATHYLIFVQNFSDRTANKADYQGKLISSQARVKYYIAGRDEPAVTYTAPFDFEDPKLGTAEAYQTEWLAWLVSCIDGERSEVPRQLVSQNGIWWTHSLNKWYTAAPVRADQNFPSVSICDL